MGFTLRRTDPAPLYDQLEKWRAGHAELLRTEAELRTRVALLQRKLAVADRMSAPPEVWKPLGAAGVGDGGRRRVASIDSSASAAVLRLRTAQKRHLLESALAAVRDEVRANNAAMVAAEARIAGLERELAGSLPWRSRNNVGARGVLDRVRARLSCCRPSPGL